MVIWSGVIDPAAPKRLIGTQPFDGSRQVVVSVASIACCSLEFEPQFLRVWFCCARPSEKYAS